MQKLFKKKFTGTGHVLGDGAGEEGSQGGGDGNRNSLIDRLEEKKRKKVTPPKVSLTEHLQKLEKERKEAPLLFCQDTPEPSKMEKEDEVEVPEEEMEVQISLLLSAEESVTSSSVALLRRILRNLILHPSEPKYRRLNLGNAKVKEGLVDVPGALDFVCLCGFAVKEEQLIYDESDSSSSTTLARHGLQLLNRHFPEAVQKPETAQTDKQTPEPQKNEDVPKRERRTQLVLLKPTEVVLPEWFFERTSAELKHEYFSMVKRKEQDETFMTREQREKLKGSKKTYSFAVLRIRLPEGVLLQGEFDATESSGRVHEWVAEQLRDPTRPFELFLPDRKKLGLIGTIERSELMPATLLSFHWTDGEGMVTREPTVQDELLTSAVLDWDLPSALSN